VTVAFQSHHIARQQRWEAPSAMSGLSQADIRGNLRNVRFMLECRHSARTHAGSHKFIIGSAHFSRDPSI